MMAEWRARVLEETPCQLGEGIAVDSITGELRWFDIPNRRRLSLNGESGALRIDPLPEMASAGAAIDHERELVFMQSGLWARTFADGSLDHVASIEARRWDMRCNDARTHPCGALWFSTMAVSQRKGAGAIYWFLRGEVRQLFPNLTVGNAICFSEAGDYAHFSDTPTGRIWRVATDPRTGLPKGEAEIFHRTARGDPSGPDGAVLDRDGHLYSCRWGGGRVDVIGPDGNVEGRIVTGVAQTTCAAFMGPDLDELAITTAHDGIEPTELARTPDAGKTFHVKLGCRGRLDPPVLLG